MPHGITLIYTRFSSENQRPESCPDQERTVRAALDRLGIDHRNATVIRDEAESGTKTERACIGQVTGMIARNEIGLLVVDDQSRLSRADNAFSFIQDLVYSGGRFVSTGEGIDTTQEGWELRVKVMELHNSTTIREIARRVHRGQQGRVLDGDGSAGDLAYSVARNCDHRRAARKGSPVSIFLAIKNFGHQFPVGIWHALLCSLWTSSIAIVSYGPILDIMHRMFTAAILKR